MKRIILLLALCLNLTCFADNIKVRIFTVNNISSVSINCSFGSYILNNDYKIRKQDKISLAVKDSKIEIKINDSIIGNKDSVILASEDLKCFFQITPTNLKARRYDNNLIVRLTKDKKNLLLINDVQQDNYIAGVAQSEAGGASDNAEFFKVQSICCRTYMMKFINKHAKDGYNLCDDVNCQVYYSRANKPQVIEGANNSSGEIIVDSNNNTIETLFHSNSGGQTMDSKDVWGNNVSYLKPVVDSFSLGCHNSVWEKEISEKEWLNYFKAKGVDIKDYNNKQEILNFSQQDGRKAKMFSIPLTQIRKDFKLKSTYFDVVPWGSNVKLKGRGYGHGVGLSQEGAARMCDEGYEYWEVIEHYYQGVKIINLNDKE